ncbi:MAG: carboxypeptidase regulatory-like domain-containing protein [Planctomycetota bacterium]
MSHRSTPLLAVLGLVLVASAWWWSAQRTPPPAIASAVQPQTEDVTRPGDLASPASIATRTDATSTDSSSNGAASLTGRVVLPAGTPDDESVEVLVAERDETDEDARAFPVGADGSFEVRVPSNVRFVRLVLRARYAFLREPLFLDLDEERGRVVLEPELGGALRARIALPEGVPIERVTGTRAVARGRVLRVTSRTTSERLVHARIDAEGMLELGGLAPDAQHVLAIARSACAPFEGGPYRVEAGRVREIDVTLAVGATVAGRVVDESGKPVEGCELALAALSSTAFFDAIDATSERDGTFRIEGGAPGKTIVRARKQGFLVTRSKPVLLVAGETTKEIEIALERGGSVRGRVTWPDGSPAADASLALALGMDPGNQLAQLGSAAPRTATSASDGTFTFDALTEGPFALAAFATSPSLGLCSALVERVTPGAEPIDVALAPGHALRVTVKDELGAPLDECAVEASFEYTAMIELEPRVTAARTAPESFELRGLRPGNWKVRAWSGACSVERRATIPLDGGVLEIVLPRPAHVAGTVRDADGRAVSDATVSFRDIAKEMYSTAAPSRTRTDAHGRFRSPPLAPARFALQASSPTSAPSESKTITLRAGETHADVELDLRTGGTLAIAVRTPDGLADVGRRIDVVPQNIAGLVYASTFHTDEDGRATIPHVPPGTYQILTSPNTRELQDATGDDGRIDGFRLSAVRLTEDATVRDGVTTEVALGGAPRERIRVTGKVTSNGVPLGGVLVQVNRGRAGSQRGVSVKTDDDGNYELRLAEPGTHGFGVRPANANTTFHRDHSVPDRPDVQLDFDLPAGRIAGRVVNAAHEPVPAIGVSLVRESGDASDGWLSAGMLARADGTFSFQHVPPGRFALSTQETTNAELVQRRYAVARKNGIELAANGAVLDVELVLAIAAMVEGDVFGPNGERYVGAQVFAFDADREPVDTFSRVVTDAAGHFRVSGLSEGHAYLVARDRDLVSTSGPIVVKSGETAQAKLVLARGTTVGLDMRDTDGNGFGSRPAVVDVHGLDHTSIWGPMWTRSEAATLTGWRAGPLPPGRYVVRARDTSLGDWSATIDVSGEKEEQQFQLSVPKR